MSMRSLSTQSWRRLRYVTAYLRYGNDYGIKKKELAIAIDAVEKGIENSIYLKLDEVGE